MSSCEPSSPPPQAESFDRRTLLAQVRRVVVKIGTNVLTREDGSMNTERIEALVQDVAALRRGGPQAILVSSGAISMGMDRLGLKRKPTFLPDKQACAAVGQVRLMTVYEQLFAAQGLTIAQVLLTEDDFASRERYLNLRNTVHRLLEQRVVPIVNENDTVSTSEIEVRRAGGSGEGSRRQQVFGDNDRLSALITSKLGADLLILLSDVDGLYASAPGIPAADAPAGEAQPAPAPRAPIPLVTAITPEIEALAWGASARGRGGMQSKLGSIRVALEGGGLAVIANGGARGVVQAILAGEPIGTLFLPRRKVSSRKRWIAYATAPAGRITVNDGARKALLTSGSSLLFAGVVEVQGDFKRGDVVLVVDGSGAELARGIVNYSARDAAPFLGKRSDEIARVAGQDYEELLTRDNIVVL